MSFFKRCSSGVYLAPDYQISNALVNRAYSEDNSYRWQEEFYKKLFKYHGVIIPKPCIYKNKVCFYGGLKNKNLPEKKLGDICIADTALNYEIVNFNDIKIPNDNQYDAYFKKYIDSFYFIIRETQSGEVLLTKRGNKKFKENSQGASNEG